MMRQEAWVKSKSSSGNRDPHRHPAMLPRSTTQVALNSNKERASQPLLHPLHSSNLSWEGSNLKLRASISLGLMSPDRLWSLLLL